MARLIVRHFDSPDDVFEAEGVRTESVDLGGVTVGRTVHQPGWRWSTHVKEFVGTDLCEARHVGVVLDGRLGTRLADGTETTAGPGDVFAIPPGHDGWVVGDEPLTVLEWSGVDEWLQPLGNRRVLASLLMTDIVDSTVHVQSLGDQRWRTLLAAHNDAVRAIVQQTGGREIDTTGDGFLVAYDSAARAVRAGVRIRDAVAELALTIRTAVHAGEIELAGSDVRGIVVHETARILGLAGPGDVLVSDATRLLAAGAGLSFIDRGRHHVKGIAGDIAVYAVQA